MDLVGRYLVVFMTPEEAFQSLAGMTAPNPVQDKLVCVSGRVAGETPGIGVWVIVDGVSQIVMKARQHTEPIMEPITREPRPHLIRWEFISNASVFADKPTTDELATVRPDVGFRPR